MRVPPLFGAFQKVLDGKKKGEPGLSSIVPECGIDDVDVAHHNSHGSGRGGGSGSRALSEGSQNLEDQIRAACLTPNVLDDVMGKISLGIGSWDSKRFSMVRNLQDAVRNHGQVDLMNDKERGKVAVKRMPTRWVKTGPKEFASQYPQASERPWVDMGIVKHLNGHGYPFVCELLGVFIDKEESFVVTSFCTEGDLFSWCDRDTPPGKQREQVMAPIVAQIFNAVRFLHELGIAHRDLSLENILLTKTPQGELQVKVIDFGMATLQRMCRKEVRGKQSYTAPEMHLDAEYDAYLADEFAIGVVLFAMAAQDYPWTSTKKGACQLFEFVHTFGLQQFLKKRKTRKGNAHLIEIFTPKFIEVIEGLLAIKPRHRAVLGETSFLGGGRVNVWDMPWMNGHESGVPLSPSGKVIGRVVGG